MANQETDPATGDRRTTAARTWPSPPSSSPDRSTRSSRWRPPSRRAWSTPEQVITVPPSLQVADHTYNDSHPGNLTVDRHPRQVVERRHDQDRPEARGRAGRRVPAPVRVRPRHGPRPAPRGERAGPADLDDWSGTSIGSIPIGQGISVTAMQMLSAYNIIANDGVYVAPSLVVGHASTPRASATTPRRGASHRVVSPTTAAADACHAGRSGRRRHRHRGRHRGLRRRRQDRHRPQAAGRAAATRTRPATTTTSRPSPGSCPPRTPSCRSSS